MIMDTAFLALIAAAFGLGAVHALSPDHWLPFAALSRARHWSPRRTAGWLVVACLAHVGITVAIASGGVAFGVAWAEAVGERFLTVAGIALLVVGLTVAALARSQTVGERLTDDAQNGRLGALALVGVFAIDPCVAAVPLTFAAAPFGFGPAGVVLGAYASATLSTMLVTTLVARAGFERLPFGRRPQLTAGLAIVGVAGAVAMLGL